MSKRVFQHRGRNPVWDHLEFIWVLKSPVK